MKPGCLCVCSAGTRIAIHLQHRRRQTTLGALTHGIWCLLRLRNVFLPRRSTDGKMLRRFSRISKVGLVPDQSEIMAPLVLEMEMEKERAPITFDEISCCKHAASPRCRITLINVPVLSVMEGTTVRCSRTRPPAQSQFVLEGLLVVSTTDMLSPGKGSRGRC